MVACFSAGGSLGHGARQAVATARPVPPRTAGEGPMRHACVIAPAVFKGQHWMHTVCVAGCWLMPCCGVLLMHQRTHAGSCTQAETTRAVRNQHEPVC